MSITYQQLIFASLGGAILGIATSINYILRGKVTGMSGHIYNVISLNKSELPDKLSVLSGMIIASSIVFMSFGYDNHKGFQPFGDKDDIAHSNIIQFALAGFLVGLGTKLSNGCTSGHGLCGLPRFSIRSFVAVCTFLGTAVVFRTLVYQQISFFKSLTSKFDITNFDHSESARYGVIVGAVMLVLGFLISLTSHNFKLMKQLTGQFISLVVGVLFSMGLMISGMSRRQNILGFLKMDKNWNPSLLFVLGSGLIVNLITFNYMIKIQKKPILQGQLFNPTNSSIDWQLVVGAILFGLGWAIGGLCPGPFIVLTPVFTISIQVFWGISLIFGMFVASTLTKTSNPLKKTL